MQSQDEAAALAEMEAAFGVPSGELETRGGGGGAPPTTYAQPGQAGGWEGGGGGSVSYICASFRREERLYFTFVTLFQALIGILAIATVVLLVWLLYQASETTSTGNVVKAAGLIVAGGASGWLTKQLRDTQKQLRAAQAGLKKHCR